MEKLIEKPTSEAGCFDAEEIMAGYREKLPKTPDRGVEMVNKKCH